MLCRITADSAGQITRIRLVSVIVTSVEALAPPALLQGRDQAWSAGALASILREEGHDARPL
jgi:hypothetical protein